MKTKKSTRASLEKNRNLFFLLGLTITLGATLMAFEWKSDKQELMVLTSNWDMEEVEMLPITRPPEPPKPAVKKVIPDVLEIIDNTEKPIELDDIDWASLEDIGDAVPEIPMEDEVDESAIIGWANVQTKPMFKGGDEALMRFLLDNTKYPSNLKSLEVEGTVYIQFVVGKDGVVKNVEVLRGVDPYLDKEALRVVNLLPKWEPGKQRGKAVNVSYMLPFKFKLYN